MCSTWSDAVDLCERRGYHGPFENTAKYDGGDPVWNGMGECALCGSTRRIATEEARRRTRSRRRTSERHPGGRT